MIDYKTLSDRLAAFDDSPERKEIAELELQQKRDRLAIESAEAVIVEARSELVKIRSNNSDIDKLVDGLRQGEADKRLLESEDVLQRKIDAHLLGKSKLRNEISNRNLEADAVKTKLRLRMAEHTKGAAAALTSEVDDVLNRLTKLYADIEAMGEGFALNSALDLRRRLTLLFKGLGSEWPQVRNRTEKVSPELVAAMKKCESTIQLVERKIPEVVAIPKL